MNELTQVAQTMSSREIAQLTGKNHFHVLRDCDNLNETYEKMGLSKIGEGYFTHPNTGNKKYREYKLTKMQTFDLLTGYNAELRIKVNRRWEELEQEANKNQFALPQNYKEALVALVAEVERTEALQEQIKKDAPKVAFADAMLASKTSCLIGELAKLITQNGYKIGQNRLFDWMRSNGYLGSYGERRNLPNQLYIEQGLFEIKKGTRSGNDGVLHTTSTTKVTPKGQQYFINKFLNKKDIAPAPANAQLL